MVGSAVVGAVTVLPHSEDEIASGSRLSSVERRHAAGDRLGFPRAAFDAFRAALPPRTRFYVDVPEGAKGQFITRGAVVRTYLAFYLLPAIEVADRREADVVLHFRFDGSYSISTHL